MTTARRHTATTTPTATATRAATIRAAGSRAAGAGAVVACSVLVASCGSTPAPGTGAAGRPAAGQPPMAASATGAGGPSWAVLEMGGSRAEHNNFWQLLARPAGASRWILATPPGVAANGGLVAAPLGGQGLLAGFNPSQDLTFSPLATSRDGGRHWAPGLLRSGLAATPSALASGPGGRLLALTSRGQVAASAAGGTAWTQLTSLAALARTPAARSCGLTALTAVAFGPSGAPLLAGPCSRPGVAGLFSFTDGAWHATGPALPAALAGRRISLLRLAMTGSRMVALLTAGSTSLYAAWAPAGTTGRGPWVLSAPLALAGATVRSTATGPAGSAGVVLSTGHGVTVAGPTPAAPWQPLPALPPHTAELALGPARQISALAPDRAVLVSWRLAGTGSWVREQVMKVPLPLGSSG